MTQIVIMPGGFHPFHAGHLALYQSARRAFPRAQVFVAATNDTSTRPFPFPVKEKLAKLAGVEPGHFVQVKSPFRAEEITSKFNPEKDVLIFVRSEKDADKPPQAGGVKKDGSPSYLQPLAGQTRYEPFARHAYMAYLPTVEFGPGMTSATEIRSAWPRLNEKRKTALVMSLYPRTQGNAKLAATVVGLLDAAIGTEQSVAEGFTDDLDNIYAMHPQPEKSEQVVFLISGMTEDEFSNRWTDLPDPYLNEFGYDLPLWDADDLSRYPNLAVKRITFDQYVQLVGNYIKSEELAGSSMSRMKKGVAEGKIKLSTDPNWYGAEVGDYKASGPTVNIPANRLVGFEPDDKMNQPASKANVEKIVAGLKQGAKLPPLLVRQYKNGYQVLDGHHRFWAYKLLGVKSIPAQVVPAEDIEEITKQGVAEGSTGVSVRGWANQVRREHGADVKFWNRREGGGAVDSVVARNSQGETVGVYNRKTGYPTVFEPKQGVEENQGWAATLEEKHQGNLDADPELKQAKRFAVQHYPEFANDPDLAFDKWVQRSLEHGREDDQKQFKMLQGVAEKVKRLEQAVAQARAQQSTVEESDYIEEKWSQKYKSSINCANPKGFSQKAHCAGRKK